MKKEDWPNTEQEA